MSKMCRTCVRIIDNEYFYLDDSCFASNTLKVKDILYSCIPDLNLEVDPSSVLCRNCMSSLYIAYSFKTEAQKNEATFHIRYRINVEHFVTVASQDMLSKLIYSDINLELPTAAIDLQAQTNNAEKSEEKVVYVDVAASDEIAVMAQNLKSEELEETDETDEDEDEQKQYENDTTKMNKEIKLVFKCPECPFYSESNAGLVLHNRIHTGEKPFHCTMCSYRGKRKSYLEDHMLTHTGERPYKCLVCDKRFTKKYILKKHTQIHTGEKPYQCNRCNFRTRHKLSLTNHVNTIHKHVPKIYQPSVCYICGKCLASRDSLRSHMRIHSGVKRHVCKFCSRVFRELPMLRNHLRIHTRERPYKCTECDYVAARKAYLQEHMKVHIGKPELVQCMWCTKRYCTKLLVTKHIKEEHADEKESVEK